MLVPSLLPSPWRVCDSSSFSSLVTSLCPLHSVLNLSHPNYCCSARLTLVLLSVSAALCSLGYSSTPRPGYHLHIYNPQIPRPLPVPSPELVSHCLLASPPSILLAAPPPRSSLASLLLRPTDLSSSALENGAFFPAAPWQCVSIYIFTFLSPLSRIIKPNNFYFLNTL